MSAGLLVERAVSSTCESPSFISKFKYFSLFINLLDSETLFLSSTEMVGRPRELMGSSLDAGIDDLGGISKREMRWAKGGGVNFGL